MNLSLNSFPLSGKITVTLFLILLWSGYILAIFNTRLNIGGTPADIAGHYGEYSLSVSEFQEIEVQGFAEEEVVFDEDENGIGAESQTITPQEIVQLGHVHMLGFSFLFISLGAVLLLSSAREWIKIMLMFLLFISLAFDIGGLFLVRFISGSYAIIPFASGIATGIGMSLISLIALHDMWIRKKEMPYGNRPGM